MSSPSFGIVAIRIDAVEQLLAELRNRTRPEPYTYDQYLLRMRLFALQWEIEHALPHHGSNVDLRIQNPSCCRLHHGGSNGLACASLDSNQVCPEAPNLQSGERPVAHDAHGAPGGD